MPGKNGYEVARYIKQSPRLSHIPVVLLTGAFEPVDQARAAEAGCDGVLAKPFEPQMVIGRVKELLGKTKYVADLDADLATPPPADPDRWAPPFVDQPFSTATAPPPASPGDVANYFDRLDAAFADLSGPAAIVNDPPVRIAPPPPPPPSVSDENDWFNSQITTPAVEERKIAEQVTATEPAPAPATEPAPATAPAPAPVEPEPVAAIAPPAPALPDKPI